MFQINDDDNIYCTTILLYSILTVLFEYFQSLQLLKAAIFSKDCEPCILPNAESIEICYFTVIMLNVPTTFMCEALTPTKCFP